jgi:type I restriction enzyme, S subunit
MSNLPADWRDIRLGDYIEILYGKGLPKSQRETHGNVPVFGSNGIVGQHTSAVATPPVIIIGRKGSAGAVHFSSVASWPIDTTFFINHFPEGFDARYLCLFLQSQKLSDLNIHAAIPGIRRDDLYDLLIPIPYLDEPAQSLAEQRRIVARIEALLAEVREMRTLHEEITADSNRLIRAFLAELFPRNSAGDENEWQWVSLGDLGEVTGGGTPRKHEPTYWGGTIPWVSPKDMKVRVIEDTQDHVTEAGVENSSIRPLPAQSVLIVFRSGILAHSLPVAIAGQDLTINQDMKAIIPHGDFLSEYIAYAIQARERQLVTTCVKKGPTVHSIVGDKFWQEKIPIPAGPDSWIKQQQMVSYLNAVQKEIKEIQKTQAEDKKLLNEVEQAVLAQAFRGEL